MSPLLTHNRRAPIVRFQRKAESAAGAAAYDALQPPRLASGEAGALQPGPAPGVERLHLWALEAWHVGLDGVADLALQVGEVAVADGEALQQRLVKGEP